MATPNKTIEEIKSLLRRSFDENSDKGKPFQLTAEQIINRWLFIDNPMFGGISPIKMIDTGGAEKLKKVIINALEVNRP